MIELPKDAVGRDIQLDTKVLYDADGVQVSIRAFRYNPHECFWRVERLDGLGTPKTTALRLTPPDTWEKLEEDLDRGAESKFETCGYFGTDGTDCCACRLTCDSFKGIPECRSGLAFKDIASRIRALRGEDE